MQTRREWSSVFKVLTEKNKPSQTTTVILEFYTQWKHLSTQKDKDFFRYTKAEKICTSGSALQEMLNDIQEEGKLHHMEIWIAQRKQEHQ